MTTVSNVFSIARHSVGIGLAELRGMYTLRSWVFGWLMRIVFQVFFFALIGRYIGSDEQMRFLLVGGAVLAAALEAMVVLMSAMSDRSSGMLSLLVSTPGDYFTVYLFRHLNYLGTGLVTSTVALFLGSVVMGVHLPLPQAVLVVPLIALGAATSYVFAAFLGALTARATHGYWLSLNLSYMSLMALSGFTIPLGSWPWPFVWIAQALPFTHALQAIRGVLGDSPEWPFLLGQVALELVLLLVWLGLARIAFRVTLSAARRNGGIELPA